jgi:hypothetical protein
MWAAEVAEGDVALMRIPIRSFSNRFVELLDLRHWQWLGLSEDVAQSKLSLWTGTVAIPINYSFRTVWIESKRWARMRSLWELMEKTALFIGASGPIAKHSLSRRKKKVVTRPCEKNFTATSVWPMLRSKLIGNLPYLSFTEA